MINWEVIIWTCITIGVLLGIAALILTFISARNIKKKTSELKTLHSDLKPGMKAYDEEVFGPVVCIWKVKNVEEALKIANDTTYGLGASIYTENVPNAEKIARRIDSGMVYVNKQVSSSPDLPFGGVKHSGYGRELSKAGILEFVNKKLIMIAK